MHIPRRSQIEECKHITCNMAAMIVEVHLVLANLHEKILHVIMKRIIALTLGVSHHIIEDTQCAANLDCAANAQVTMNEKRYLIGG